MSHPEELPPHQPSLTERAAERVMAAPRWLVMLAAAVVVGGAILILPTWVPPLVLAVIGAYAWVSSDRLKPAPTADGLLLGRDLARHLSVVMGMAGGGLAVMAFLAFLERLLEWLGWLA